MAKNLMGQRSQEESQLLVPAGGQSLLLDPFLGSESTYRPMYSSTIDCTQGQGQVLGCWVTTSSEVVQSKVVRYPGRIQHP